MTFYLSPKVAFVLFISVLSSCKSINMANMNLAGKYEYSTGGTFAELTRLVIKKDNTFYYAKLFPGTTIEECSGKWIVLGRNKMGLQCLTDSTFIQMISTGYIGASKFELRFKSNDKIKLGKLTLRRVKI